MTASSPHTVKSSEKLLQIVNVLAEDGISRITEISDETNIHKSTVYVHLQTLKENGIVVKKGSKYRLSLVILQIGEKIRNHRPVYQFGKGEIDSLAKETGELVCLSVPEDEATVAVHTSHGQKVSQTMSVGTRIPMLDGPMGKVLLAYRARDATSTEGFSLNVNQTSRPVEQIERDDLISEFKDIRNDGYCISTDQNVDGIPYVAEPEHDEPRAESHRADIKNREIAAPILFHDEPVGAIGVISPSKRLSGDYCDDVRQQVVQTAAMIEKKLHINQNSPEIHAGELVDPN